MTSADSLPTSRFMLWTVPVLFALLFLADCVTPQGVVVCFAYAPVLCLALWFQGRRTVFTLAAIATVLPLLAAFFKEHSALTAGMPLANQILSAAACWGAATAVYRYRLAVDEYQSQASDHLRREVDTREALMAAIVASSDDAIIGKSLDGIIQSWNRGAREIFGYTAEEAVGRHITMLIPEELRYQEEGIVAELVQGKQVDHLETVRLHQSGRRLEVSITVLPVKDETGKVVAASKNVREIGKRKRTEAMLSAVVDNASDGIITIDERGAMESFNRASERLFGYKEEEMLGQNLKVLMPPHYHEAHDASFFRYLRTGEARVIGRTGVELTARRKDGSDFPMDLSVSVFKIGAHAHFAGIIRDISDRKKAEADAAAYTQALIRSNQALDEFAYAASHDLKAPLRVIDNASKWLEEDLAEHLSGEDRENMQLLRGRVRRMENLLNDLLAYSRIGRKTDPAYSEVVVGSELIADVLALVSPPESFPVSVSPAFADIQVCRMPLQQVLTNLIANAVKHHDKQSGKIEVTVKPGDPMHIFAVKDDGPGIDPRFHLRIFDMFQTLKPRDQVEGSGMGLAMVRKHIELMGGTIAVDSAEGSGSTFRFTWPARQPHIGVHAIGANPMEINPGEISIGEKG